MAEDRRIRKTKRLLREGLATLMQEKSVNHITVRELAEYADINRATFYAHYKDVYDLKQQTEAELMAEFAHILESNRLEGKSYDLPAFLTDLLAYIGENGTLAYALLCKHGDISFIQSIQELIGDFFKDYWKNGEHQFWHYSTAFLVSGGTGMIQQWVAEGMPEPPEEMAKIMIELLSQGLAGRDVIP